MSDRKYKQGSYQSSGEAPRPPRERAAARPSGPPPERGERPRGRGLGAPTAEVFRCARCGELATVAAAAGETARCAGCGADLHSCTNCTYFDTGARFECRREVPARVSPKDRANRCELFEPRLRHEFAPERSPATTNAKSDAKNDAKSAFDALFKR
jgi:hypothetical protein